MVESSYKGPWAGLHNESWPASNTSVMNSVIANSYCDFESIIVCFEPVGVMCAIQLDFENCASVQALSDSCPSMPSGCDEESISDSFTAIDRIFYLSGISTYWGIEIETQSTTYSFPETYDDSISW